MSPRCWQEGWWAPEQGGSFAAWDQEGQGWSRECRQDSHTAAASEELREEAEEIGWQEDQDRGSPRQPCWMEVASSQPVDAAG